MKFLIFAILVFPHVSDAQHHDHHNHHKAEELKAETPLSQTSILHLESTWKNHKNETVNLKSLKGKPRLVVMLFTRCETACPLIVEDLKNVTADIDGKGINKIDVSLFSIDSFRETPESLKSFSEKRKLPGNWELFTSDATAVSELAAALGVRYKRLANGDFIHSNVIYFLNSGGDIIAQKEGIKSPRSDFVKKVKMHL